MSQYEMMQLILFILDVSKSGPSEYFWTACFITKGLESTKKYCTLNKKANWLKNLLKINNQTYQTAETRINDPNEFRKSKVFHLYSTFLQLI